MYHTESKRYEDPNWVTSTNRCDSQREPSCTTKTETSPWMSSTGSNHSNPLMADWPGFWIDFCHKRVIDSTCYHDVSWMNASIKNMLGVLWISVPKTRTVWGLVRPSKVAVAIGQVPIISLIWTQIVFAGYKDLFWRWQLPGFTITLTSMHPYQRPLLNSSPPVSKARPTAIRSAPPYQRWDFWKPQITVTMWSFVDPKISIIKPILS